MLLSVYARDQQDMVVPQSQSLLLMPEKLSAVQSDAFRFSTTMGFPSSEVENGETTHLFLENLFREREHQQFKEFSIESGARQPARF